MPTKIIVIGGKGTAVNVAESILDARRRFGLADELLGFAIDDPSLGSDIAGIPIVSTTENLSGRWRSSEVKFLFCLFKPDRMRERVALLKSYNLPPQRFYTFIHPSAYVSPTAQAGVGSAVLANCALHYRSTLGDFCIVNSNVVVEHDAIIGEANFIAASACLGAAVRTGAGVFIGLKAALREELNIGDYAFVGMGSVVTRDVPEGATVFGVPARLRR